MNDPDVCDVAKEAASNTYHRTIKKVFKIIWRSFRAVFKEMAEFFGRVVERVPDVDGQPTLQRCLLAPLQRK